MCANRRGAEICPIVTPAPPAEASPHVTSYGVMD